MGRRTSGPMPPQAPPPEPHESAPVEAWEESVGQPIFDPQDEAIRGSKATWGEEPAEQAAERVAAWPDVFLRSDGASLTWLEDRGRPGMRPVLHALDVPTLRGLLSARRVAFTEREKREDGAWATRKVPPPTALTERIVMTRPGDDWRVLDGLAHAPYLVASGEVVSTAGYRNGLWLSKSGALDLRAVPNVARLQPDGYGPEDAAQAAEVLLSDLSGIEWGTDADRSASLAYFLTLVSRPSYRLCPIFLFTAPFSGSGKDLVAKCWENAAYGYEALRVNPSPGRMEEAGAELDKRIGAAMLEGESTIVIGDMRHLVSPTLYGLTTEGRAQGFRVLGQSTSIPVPRNLVLAGIGNNPEIGVDIVRRAVSVRIVPKTNKPAERRFALSEEALIARYRNRRAEYICLAANIIRGAIKNPPDKDALISSSFGGWSRMVQAACVYAGLPDPLLSREALQRRVVQDDALSLLAPLIAAWWRLHGVARLTSTQALAPLHQMSEDLNSFAYREALRAIDPKITAQRLGSLLAKADDQNWLVPDISSADLVHVRLRSTRPGNVAHYELERVR